MCGNLQVTATRAMRATRAAEKGRARAISRAEPAARAAATGTAEGARRRRRRRQALAAQAREFSGQNAAWSFRCWCILCFSQAQFSFKCIFDGSLRWIYFFDDSVV